MGLPRGNLRTNLGPKLPGEPGDLKKQPKPNKYRNESCTVNGIWFQSQAEGNRYVQLRLLEDAGRITSLRRQPRFLLQEAFIDADGNTVRKMEYNADFAYFEPGNEHEVVEDVKGKQTEVFKLKSKLFRKRYPEKDFRLITNHKET
jgi:hypothetical protein